MSDYALITSTKMDACIVSGVSCISLFVEVDFMSDVTKVRQTDVIEVIINPTDSPETRWTTISDKIIARATELGYSITEDFIHTTVTIKAQSVATRGISIINPSSSENVTIWAANNPFVINHIVAVVRGSTPSVTWTLKKSNDRSSAGVEVITGGTTTTSTTGSTVTTMDSPNIANGDFVWLEITATSGTVNEFHVTIYMGRNAA